jgi:hypothetical protein
MLALADAAAREGITLSHHELLSGLRIETGMAPGTGAGIGPARMHLEAFGRALTLELEPNAGLLGAMAASGIDRAIVPYRGTVAGIPGSWASITLVDGVPAGLVWDCTDLYAVEAPNDSLVTAAGPVMYRVADAVIAPGALSCATGGEITSGAEAFESTVANISTALAAAPGATLGITLGAVGDFEFTHTRTDPEGAIVTRLNNVDVIFSEQVGVQLDVPFIETFAEDDDPFTATTNPGELLPQVGSYRSTTPGQRGQGLTHLYTGRDLDGNTVGIAYSGEGTLCHNYFGAGLSMAGNNPTFDSLVAAHEIGHNFGAPHDGEAGSPCETVTGEFIMAATLNNSDQFSACSIEQMQPHIAAASCINPLPSTDVSIAYSGQPPTVLLSNAATITFDVVNNGTQIASNVVADITLPANVELVTASGSTATCTDGAGTVSCELANLAGGSAATVTVSANTIATGAGVFEAVVSAEADDDDSNNAASVQVTVDPAVDLVANAPLSASVEVGRTANVAVIIDNESTLAATGVTLAIELEAGIRATAASWPAGSCTVADQQVDCSAASLDGLSTATLRLDVVGEVRGMHSVTVTAASAETDADSANNTASGSVRVTEAASGNADDGGGGGVGFPFLGMLGLVFARRRFRPS